MKRAKGEGSAGLILGILAVFGSLFFILPLLGLVLQASWANALTHLFSPAVLQALWLSLVTSISAVILSLVFGFPLAWILARWSFPGRKLLRTLVVLPMVLPPVVTGVALLTAFGRIGVVGSILDRLGIQLSFSLWGAILAATFVSCPFLITSLESALLAQNRNLENAAASFGATRWRILKTVTLPALKPSILAGGCLVWARALGEFGATITFVGNLRGRTQTLPLAVYETLQTNVEGALLMSLLLLGVSIVVLYLLRGRITLG